MVSYQTVWVRVDNLSKRTSSVYVLYSHLDLTFIADIGCLPNLVYHTNIIGSGILT